MKFIKYTGYNGSYLTFEVENGDNNLSKGDWLWFSPDGKEMSIWDGVSIEQAMYVVNLFENKEDLWKVFKKYEIV